MTRPERQLINKCGGENAGAIDGSTRLFERVVEGITGRVEQVVQLLTVGVSHHEREAVREAPVERDLQGVVGRIAKVRPGIRNSCILRKGTKHLGDATHKVRERQADFGEGGMSRRNSGWIGSTDRSDPKWSVIDREDCTELTRPVWDLWIAHMRVHDRTAYDAEAEDLRAALVSTRDLYSAGMLCSVQFYAVAE